MSPVLASIAFEPVNLTDIALALIAGLPGIIAAFYGRSNSRKIKTPSGDTLGNVVERTHDLAAVGVAAVTGTNGEKMDAKVQKLNDDARSGVTLPANVLSDRRSIGDRRKSKRS